MREIFAFIEYFNSVENIFNEACMNEILNTYNIQLFNASVVGSLLFKDQ